MALKYHRINSINLVHVQVTSKSTRERHSCDLTSVSMATMDLLHNASSFCVGGFMWISAWWPGWNTIKGSHPGICLVTTITDGGGVVGK